MFIKKKVVYTYLVDTYARLPDGKKRGIGMSRIFLGVCLFCFDFFCPPLLCCVFALGSGFGSGFVIPRTGNHAEKGMKIRICRGQKKKDCMYIRYRV